MAAGQIKGQLNVLDFMKRERTRPCDYEFFRYIGQRVCLYRSPEWTHGTVTAFDDYYTVIRPDGGGGSLAGTPYNTITEAKWKQREIDRAGIQNITVEEVAEILGRKLNLKFVPGKFFEQFHDYECRMHGYVIEVSVDTYSASDRKDQKFIGVTLNNKTSGASAQCDSIEEAESLLRKYIDRAERERANGANSKRKDQRTAKEYE